MEERNPSELTEKQKQLLLDVWKLLEDNIARIGVITFLRLFETHPDVQGFFPSLSGMTMDDLRHSKQLQTHALKVMGFVQKVVARLEEPTKLHALVRQLGRSHYHYGAKQAYIDFVGPQFVYAIKPALEDQWSEELESAWLALFGYIGTVMKASMTEAQQGKGMTTTTTTMMTTSTTTVAVVNTSTSTTATNRST